MSTQSMALNRWIPWVAAANQTDWDAVYAEELPRVYNFFRYRVGDGADAEDLTSITFEKAWRARHRYRRDLAKFRTWLLAIARNVAIDHYRRARRHAPLEDAAHVAGGPDPQELAAQRSEFERLSRMLEGLAPRERELIALKYGAGLTNRTIAGLTNLTESNVGTILHRTIHGLRSEWMERGE